jgi:hypothetical protein
MESGWANTVAAARFDVTRLATVKRFDVATRLLLFVNTPPAKPTRDAV